MSVAAAAVLRLGRLDVRRRAAVVALATAAAVAAAGAVAGDTGAVAAAAGLVVGLEIVVLGRLREELGQLRCIASLAPLGFRYPVSFESGWTLSPDVALSLAEHIARLRPRVVVECGSGTSTVVMASCLRAIGAGRVVALEDVPALAERAAALLALHGVADHATIVHAPIVRQDVGGETWDWYRCEEALRGIDAIDLLVVDGPSTVRDPLARYPALALLADRLAPRAVVILDDGKRAGERAVAARWLRHHPDFEGRLLETQKGMWILARRSGAVR
jgi:predicted O-methyltransferase YrrM